MTASWDDGEWISWEWINSQLEDEPGEDAYSAMGPPTLLLIGPDGIERRSQRVIGEVNASEFLRKWNETMERG